MLQNAPNCTIDNKSVEYAPIPLNIVCAIIPYLEKFSRGVEKFSGGGVENFFFGGGAVRKFSGGVEIFSRVVRKFREGLRFFREELRFFREGLRFFRGD